MFLVLEQEIVTFKSVGTLNLGGKIPASLKKDLDISQGNSIKPENNEPFPRTYVQNFAYQTPVMF